MYFLNLIILINSKVNETDLKLNLRIYKQLKLIVPSNESKRQRE